MTDPTPDSGAKRFTRLARERLTLSSEVTEILRWQIIEGQLEPGTRLGEERISREMEISRGPVREALRELENEGLIATEPYRGAIVIGISEEELRGVLIPVRWILEKAAITVAMTKVTELDFQNLETITTEMRRISTSGAEDTLRQLVELDVAFHRYIVDCSGQYHTKQLWSAIQPRIRMGFYQLGSRHYHSDEIAQEHEDLLDALRTKDVEVARKALDAHAMTSPLELLDRAVPTSAPKHPSARTGRNSDG